MFYIFNKHNVYTAGLPSPHPETSENRNRPRDVLNAQLKIGDGGEGDGGEAVSNETGVGFVHSTWWKFSLSGNSVSILFYFKSDMKYFNQILKL